MAHTELLEKYLNGITLLQNAVSSLTNEQINYLPDRKDSWSIHEHVIHIVDSELHFFIKTKSIIAQPHSLGYALESETWSNNVKNKKEDIHKYLSIFPLLRQIIVELIKDEPDSTWNDYLIWPYHGKNLNVTLEECIDAGIRHISYHLDYIQKNIVDFEKQVKHN